MKNKGVGDLYNGIASQLAAVRTRDARPKDRRPPDRRPRPPKATAAAPVAPKPALRVVGGIDADKAIPETVKPEPRKSARITADMIARARQKKPEATRINPFVLANHPPGVFPKGRGTTLAQDEAIASANNWAAQAIITGAWDAGLGFMGYTYLSELAQRAEYRVIVETLATESTRKWIKLQATTEDGEDRTERLKQLNDEIERLKLRDVMRMSSNHDGYFGRGHIYLDTGDTDNTDELMTPLGNGRNAISKAKIGKRRKLKRLQNVEPIWCYPSQYNSNNPLKPDWYKPSHWFAMGNEIHHSRLLTFVARPVPDLLKPAYSFGGLAMTQMAKPTVDNWLRTRQSVSDITHAYSVMVLETDMSETLGQNGEQLFARLDLFNALRDNRGTMAINKDSEKLTNVAAPLGSLDLLQAQAQEHMASISRTPIVKLLGIQPAGLNASSEGEINTWDDWVAAYQEMFYREPVTRLLGFAMLNLWGAIDPGITFVFEPLRQMTEKERAELRKSKADADGIYVDKGVLAPEEVRASLASEEDSPYASIDVDDVPEPPEPEGGGGDDDGAEPPVGETDEAEVSQDAVPPFVVAGDAEFNEADHPRGQPGNAGQFGSSGGGSKPDAGKILTEQYAAAQKDLKARSDRGEGTFGSSRHELADGSILITSLQPKQGNSRGAKRGGHMTIEYNLKKPGEQYAKRVSKAKATELLTAAPAAAHAETPTFSSKKDHAAHLLEKGVTTKEMLTALGWPSISMPQMAKSLGMKLEKVKQAGGTVYKGTSMTAAERKAAGIKDPSTGRGPASRDQATWSLTEYLAHLGGIKSTDPLIGDVHGSIGKKNKLIPGFGPIVRPGGMTLDKAREAAMEAGYISRTDKRTDNTTVRTLLDAMDNEFRGRKVYRQGVDAPNDTERDRESHINAIETHIGESLRDVDIDPSTVPPSTMDRIVEIMDREGESDALIAYERAVMEETENESPDERIDDAIEGWDVPDDGGATPPASR